MDERLARAAEQQPGHRTPPARADDQQIGGCRQVKERCRRHVAVDGRGDGHRQAGGGGLDARVQGLRLLVDDLVPALAKRLDPQPRPPERGDVVIDDAADREARAAPFGDCRRPRQGGARFGPAVVADADARNRELPVAAQSARGDAEGIVPVLDQLAVVCPIDTLPVSPR